MALQVLFLDIDFAINHTLLSAFHSSSSEPESYATTPLRPHRDHVCHGFAISPASGQGTRRVTGKSVDGQIQAENCVVRYIEKVPIPARADGSLVKINFKEGDTVKKDDELAVIDDTAARLAIELKKAELKEAMLNAANDVNIRNARNSAKLAKAEAESFKELRKEGAIPFWEMKKKEFEADKADLAIELAEMNTKVAEVQMIAKRSELAMAEFELTRRKVLAPLTGQIEERIAQTGQWVQPGDPIATLIQMDMLRVEGDVDALRYPGKVHQGRAGSGPDLYRRRKGDQT